MSLALARKYRPKRFADVAVQSHVSATLQGAIARGRVAHGYLLCGPRGVGKTTLARVLAMALNCERRGEAGFDGEPCGACASCERIWSGSASLDVVEIDAASNRGVDDARELRERAMYAPSGPDRYKVYIVDEAHMLTREAWNALLKILEEPPPRVVFVFATTEPQRIAQAAAPVLSRLQRFDFKRIGPSDIHDRLRAVLAAESVAADGDALSMIARAADGSMRDALSLADQVLSTGDGRITASRVRDALGLVAEDEFVALLDVIADRRAADVFTVVGRLADAGIDFGAFLIGLADMLRGQLAVVLGGSPTDVSDHARQALQERRTRFSAADLLRMLSALTELEPRFRKSAQQQLLLETLLVRFALLDRSIALEELLRTIGDEDAGRSRGGGGEGSEGSEGREGGGVRRSVAGSRSTRAGPPDGSASARDTGARGFTESVLDRPVAIEVGGARSAPVRPTAGVPVLPVPERAAGVRPSPSVHLLAERWDELADQLRHGGKTMLATAIKHASPVAVTARGEVTIELDEPNEFYEQAFDAGRADVLAVLEERFSGIQRVRLRRADGARDVPTPKRLTDDDLRAERLSSLRKRDPVLGAAIDALDLDVAE